MQVHPEVNWGRESSSLECHSETQKGRRHWHAQTAGKVATRTGAEQRGHTGGSWAGITSSDRGPTPSWLSRLIQGRVPEPLERKGTACRAVPEGDGSPSLYCSQEGECASLTSWASCSKVNNSAWFVEYCGLSGARLRIPAPGTRCRLSTSPLFREQLTLCSPAAACTKPTRGSGLLSAFPSIITSRYPSCDSHAERGAVSTSSNRGELKYHSGIALKLEYFTIITHSLCGGPTPHTGAQCLPASVRSPGLRLAASGQGRMEGLYQLQRVVAVVLPLGPLQCDVGGCPAPTRAPLARGPALPPWAPAVEGPRPQIHWGPPIQTASPCGRVAIHKCWGQGGSRPLGGE